MLTENALIQIHRYIKKGFGEEIAQEVTVRLLERPYVFENQDFHGWQAYGRITARSIACDKYNEGKRLVQLEGIDQGATLYEAVENQVIARETLRRLTETSNKHAVKIVRYSLYGDKTYSRQYVEQLRRQLREELK